MSADGQFLTLMAIGDAFGMRYEFALHDCDITEKDLCYAPHPTFIEYKTGRYTDDTQMSLANAELLLHRLSRGLQGDDYAGHWLTCFQRDPRAEYSRHMFKTLSESTDIADFKSRIVPKGTTSGAAMRAGPFGLLANTESVKLMTREQAVITHDTRAGIGSAMATALAVHFLHHGGRKHEMISFIHHHLTPAWNAPVNGFTHDFGTASIS